MTLRAPGAAVPGAIRFSGLDPDRRYRVRPLVLHAPPRTGQDQQPAWLAADSVTMTGRVLGEVGLPPPLLIPEQAAVFAFEAVSC